MASPAEQRLVFVTGKGGTGKTTVAAAIAMAAASRGRRALVCDLSGAGQLARAFGCRELAAGELQLDERLWALSLDPDEALREWLRRQPGGAAVAALLSHSQVFAHFVAAVPGVKELVTIGKVIDLAGGTPGRARYDLVIADALSTGHALGMLAAPHEMAGAVVSGPVADQAGRLAEYLADPVRTGFVGVALPEEMAVQETLDLERGLRETFGRGLDLIVVNGLYADRFTDEEEDRLEALADEGHHEQLLRMVLAHHRRARVQAGHVDWLRRHTDAPLVTLPYLFTRELGPCELERLGTRLVSQVRAGCRATGAESPHGQQRLDPVRVGG